MLRVIRFFTSTFLLVYLFTILAVGPVFAQTTSPTSPPLPEGGINLTISPIFLNLVTDPGKPVSSQLRVTNNSNQTEFLKIDVAKFEAGKGGEAAQILDVTDDDEFTKWISFSAQSFTLDPNETKTIRFTVSPDAKAAFGYYYALIVNRVREAENKQGTTAVSGAPAFLVLLEVRSPNAKRELQLVDFATTSLWYEYLPAKFVITLKNTGNIHVVPAGDIFIDQGEKRDVGIIRANATRGNILPDSRRTYEAQWDDGFLVNKPKEENGKIVRDKNGNIQYETKWDFAKADRFRIGKYTAHLLLVYDNGKRDVPIEASVSFWVIPWKIIGLFIVVLYFVFMGVRSTLLTQIKRIKGILKKQ